MVGSSPTLGGVVGEEAGFEDRRCAKKAGLQPLTARVVAEPRPFATTLEEDAKT